jgi:N-acetylgalactosamine kinase
MAGYRAGVEHLDNNSLVGMQIMITGNVPLGSGLSSSAALVVSSGLASYYANNQNGKRQASEFIEECIKRERSCGVACGGMDQSISVMGKLLNCLYIQFNPIRCEAVHVPEGCKLIIMNSLVENVKANSAVFRYNKRVVECRLGLYLLCKNLKID